MKESLKREYRFKLLCGSPVYFYGKELKVPTLKEISTLGYAKYSEKLFAFSLSEDFLKQIPGYKLSLFTTLIIVEEYRKRFVEGLCYFFDLKVNDIEFDVKVYKGEDGIETFSPLVKFKGIFINEFRFKELKELILLVTCNEEIVLKQKEEQSVKIKAEYLDRWNSFMKAKAEHENKEKQKEQGMEMYKMIIYLATKTKYNLDYIVGLNLEQFNSIFLGEICDEKNEFELTKLSTGQIMSKDLDLKSLFDRIKQAIK